MVTSNHVHLLAFDNSGRNVIPDSIKLVDGRTGQEYNVRKNSKGAFWEDRYHATAVESNLRSKIEKKVDIFLIPVFKLLQIQKASSYHLIYRCNPSVHL